MRRRDSTNGRGPAYGHAGKVRDQDFDNQWSIGVQFKLTLR
jgi:hypothetical protein